MVLIQKFAIFEQSEALFMRLKKMDNFQSFENEKNIHI